MNHFLFLTIAFFLMQLTGYANNTPSKSDLLQLGLPVLQIETIDHEEPTYEEAEAPEGCMGHSIKNATKVPGRVRIETLNEGIIFDSGEYESKKSGMTVKVRGNTSARYNPKKPYKIKLEKKGDMLCRGNALYNDKNWLLLRVDNINTLIGFKTSELLNMEWTPQYEFVNVIFNDDYRGLYLLVEAVERNTDCRLNAGKTGFIAELDAYWWNEDFAIPSILHTPDLSYTFKYPDAEDITPEKAEYFTSTLQTAELAMRKGGYNTLIDETSFAKWILAMDILGNIDGAGSNLYLSKYDDSPSSLLSVDCLWDFDNILRNEDKWSENHTHFIFKDLFACPDKSFVRAYTELWEESGLSTIEQLTQFIDSFATSTLAESIDASNSLDYERWYMKRSKVSELAEKAKQYLSRQGAWLETNIAIIAEDITEDISTKLPGLHKENVQPCSSYIYSVNGIRHNNSQQMTGQRQGIYIINGKKGIR